MPKILSDALDAYVNVVRPRLLGDRVSDKLWISSTWAELSDVTMYIRIAKITKREVGTAMGLHIFRDCLTTMIAVRDLDHILVAPVMLGHTIDTNTRHYNQAKRNSATHRVQQEILTMRRNFESEGKLRRRGRMQG